MGYHLLQAHERIIVIHGRVSHLGWKIQGRGVADSTLPSPYPSVVLTAMRIVPEANYPLRNYTTVSADASNDRPDLVKIPATGLVAGR